MVSTLTMTLESTTLKTMNMNTNMWSMRQTTSPKSMHLRTTTMRPLTVSVLGCRAAGLHAMDRWCHVIQACDVGHDGRLPHTQHVQKGRDAITLCAHVMVCARFGALVRGAQL